MLVVVDAPQWSFSFFRFAQQKSSLDSIHQSTFTKRGAIPLRPTCFRNHDTCYSGGTLSVAETKRETERALLPSTQTHTQQQHSLAKTKRHSTVLRKRILSSVANVSLERLHGAVGFRLWGVILLCQSNSYGVELSEAANRLNQPYAASTDSRIVNKTSKKTEP